MSNRLGARKRRLTEGQLAVVGQSMGRVTRVEDYIERMIGELNGCNVFIDNDSLAEMRRLLDGMHGDLAAQVMGHIDEIEASK